MFLFLRIVADVLTRQLEWHQDWRLIDMWNNMSLLGRACLGFSHELMSPAQPSFLAAGLTLAGVSTLCLIYLNLRTRAVDIIS